MILVQCHNLVVRQIKLTITKLYYKAPLWAFLFFFTIGYLANYLSKYLNNNKKEIDDFSDYYQKRMNELEPNVLSWKFFKSQNGQIILLERYINEEAIFNHIENVSEGNPMEQDFIKFLDHFLIDSIEYYGKTSQDFKDTIETFGFPISYKELISGFSK